MDRNKAIHAKSIARHVRVHLDTLSAKMASLETMPNASFNVVSEEDLARDMSSSVEVCINEIRRVVEDMMPALRS